jgi:hypothetical protein
MPHIGSARLQYLPKPLRSLVKIRQLGSIRGNPVMAAEAPVFGRVRKKASGARKSLI